MNQSPDPNREAFAQLVAEVYDAAGVLRRRGDRIASAAGQTQARWQLLSVVSVDAWTVPAAADRLGTSRQAVQRVANELVDDGLAVFVDNPRHRRSPLLRLTGVGERALAAITAEAQRRNRALLGEVGDIDLAATCDALRRVAAVVRAELDRATDAEARSPMKESSSRQ